MNATDLEIAVQVRAGDADLEGNLAVPAGARGLVLFAHGSGSSRFSPRNRFVAGHLRGRNLGTLLIDLLTADEEAVDERTGHIRFDINLLAERLAGASAWLEANRETRGLPIGYFGASTGAAAALVAAAKFPESIGALVSRGGRPDLAGPHLRHVQAPTLLIVGGEDTVVIELNEEAYRQLRCAKEMQIVPRRHPSIRRTGDAGNRGPPGRRLVRPLAACRRATRAEAVRNRPRRDHRMTQVDAFQITLQKTGEWLRDIRQHLQWETDQRAYLALRAVLHTLRDRLPVAEAVHLGSQLPMLVRGFYYEGWKPLDKPLKFTHDEFLMAVASYFREPSVDAMQVIRAVIETMGEHIDPRELAKLIRVLPRDFADLVEKPAA
jgi:uncharacterized protein (DUF2267 family)/dienelactone hydrolase